MTIRAKLTERYQTTIPSAVRAALDLKKSDTIHFEIAGDGSVTLRKQAAEEHLDPVIRHFLLFLERDMVDRPDSIRPVDQALKERLDRLVGHLDVDLDAPL